MWKGKIRTVCCLALTILVFAASGFLPGCSSGTIPPGEEKSPQGSSSIVRDKIPRMVDLGRTFCIPCKMMAPILEGLKKEYAGRLQVEFIDIGKNPNAARKYGIRLIPTQIFFDASGKEVYRHEGFMSKADILAAWKKHGLI